MRAAVLLLAALSLAGCATVVSGQPHPIGTTADDADKALVGTYFTDLNSAADQGTREQRDYLRRTQHPDFADRFCDLGDLTLRVEPALSTLRPDPKWRPERATQRPRGTVYVVGVSIAVRRENTTLGEQIGSQRVVVLDGTVYGFTPCPTG